MSEENLNLDSLFGLEPCADTLGLLHTILERACELMGKKGDDMGKKGGDNHDHYASIAQSLLHLIGANLDRLITLHVDPAGTCAGWVFAREARVRGGVGVRVGVRVVVRVVVRVSG